MKTLFHSRAYIQEDTISREYIQEENDRWKTNRLVQEKSIVYSMNFFTGRIQTLEKSIKVSNADFKDDKNRTEKHDALWLSYMFSRAACIEDIRQISKAWRV